MTKKDSRTKTGDLTLQESKALCLTQSIMSLRHRLYKMVSETAGDYNLKSSELALIISLGRSGTQSMSDLARACFFSPPNATYIVSSLEKKALVKRERSDKSSRVVYVNLTPSGQAVFEKNYPSIIRRLDSFFDQRLSFDQIESLEKLLNRLNAN
ncbi:MarR family winged helix-turn-helix transcriptional regulator [Emcibacter sp.]|uniref:MarR family winged helix-turn-helix transcriptional regulator n=1 Tax=Emcibacter sp. TaxID=1979954 RepID=UPI003A8D4D28